MLQQRGILDEGKLEDSIETVVFCLGVYEMKWRADIRKGPPISKPALPNRKGN